MSDSDQGAALRLDRDGGGYRHFVGDVPIHCGDPIAAQLDGRWIEGRYEGSGLGRSSSSDPAPAAFFYYVDQFQDSRCVRLQEGALVRLSSGNRF